MFHKIHTISMSNMCGHLKQVHLVQPLPMKNIVLNEIISQSPLQLKDVVNVATPFGSNSKVTNCVLNV
jgi:hypothetical protein